MENLLNINFNFQNEVQDAEEQNMTELFCELEKKFLDVLEYPKNHNVIDFDFEFYQSIFKDQDIYEFLETSGLIQKNNHYFTVHLFNSENYNESEADEIFQKIIIPAWRYAATKCPKITLISGECSLYLAYERQINQLNF